MTAIIMVCRFSVAMPMRDYEGLEKTLLDISDIYR